MRALALVMSLVLANGCAAVPVVPTVRAEKRVEDRPLPPDPAVEALPEDTPKGDWVDSLEAASCLDKQGKPVPGATVPCPARNGIASSEARAARDALFRIRYLELRRDYAADRELWKAHRELYETRLEQAEDKLQKAQPNWFQQNAFALGMVGGFILGGIATVTLTYAVNQASTTPTK